MDRPKINTAIPKRRYLLGEFAVVVLADISSKGDLEYRYIVAVIREGESDPGLYLMVERPTGRKPKESVYGIGLIMREGSKKIGLTDRWEDVDSFTTHALEIVQTILDLHDEEPRRLL